MASWTETERTRVTVEYTIPAAEPWGACWNEVLRVLHLAQEEYFKLYQRWPSDDAIRVHVTDDAITVIYEKSNTLN